MKTPSSDQISNLCARIGFEETTYPEVVQELKRVSAEPHVIQTAYKLTKEDYENFGLPPSPNL